MFVLTLIMSRRWHSFAVFGGFVHFRIFFAKFSSRTPSTRGLSKHLIFFLRHLVIINVLTKPFPTLSFEFETFLFLKLSKKISFVEFKTVFVSDFRLFRILSSPNNDTMREFLCVEISVQKFSDIVLIFLLTVLMNKISLINVIPFHDYSMGD